MKCRRIFILLVLLLPFLNCCKKEENTPPDKNEPYDKNISAIAIQGQYVWIGTRQDGLFRFDGDEWVVFTTADGLVCDTISALATGDNGILWIGTNSGISKLENQSWTSLTEADGLFNNDIRCLACNQEGDLWIGALLPGFIPGQSVHHK